MTNPKYTTLYCYVCGTPMGRKPGQGAVVGLLCGEPSCEFVGPAGVSDTRNSLITALFHDRVSVPKIALSFGVTRQRVYQIVNDWGLGL